MQLLCFQAGPLPPAPCGGSSDKAKVCLYGLWLAVPGYRDPEAAHGAYLGVLLILQGIVLPQHLHRLPGVDGAAQHPAKGMKLNSIICAVHLGSVAHQGTLETGTECGVNHTYSHGKYHGLYLP